ncbi:MAG: putative transrane protein [Polaromonas sp.]|nr:putative transrane protein [Polaromonas sp.]
MVPAGIDWTQPWFAPYAGLVDSICTPHGFTTTAEVLNAMGPAAVRFVPQPGSLSAAAYERFVFETGTVPTREELHDFFGGLCWLRFPAVKKKLNQFHADEMAKGGVGPVRGTLRDAVTSFDENGAFLCAPAALWDALQARDWRRLFVELRPLWQEAQLVVFGHGLLEKLVRPRKPMTAHVYLARCAPGPLDALDAAMAEDMTAGGLAAKPFVTLPFMGVPGWWPENENFSFYDDSYVFRPRS